MICDEMRPPSNSGIDTTVSYEPPKYGQLSDEDDAEKTVVNAPVESQALGFGDLICWVRIESRAPPSSPGLVLNRPKAWAHAGYHRDVESP